MKKETIVVWFSCGAASAVAAKKTLEKYGDTHHVRIVNNPVVEEDADNRRFLKDAEKWLGIKVEEATNSKYPSCSAVSVWDARKFMSAPNGAPCTLELKKQARYEWEANNHADHHVLDYKKQVWSCRGFTRWVTRTRTVLDVLKRQARPTGTT